jgi:hypothetical protein
MLLRYLCRLWQVDVQHSLVKLRLDLARVRIERQRDYSAERAITALYHMPILVLVLLVALGLFSPRMVSVPLASVTFTSFSSTPGNSTVKSMASLLSAMSTFGASMSEPNPASGERLRMSCGPRGIASRMGHHRVRRTKERLDLAIRDLLRFSFLAVCKPQNRHAVPTVST